jgi:hypothetical protein
VRRYDDPVDVRKGQVKGSTGVWEGPEQFLWRGRLWQVRDVVAHWMETGPWWQSAGVRAVIGSDEPSEAAVASAGSVSGSVSGSGSVATADLLGSDLLQEREVWRVEAARGRQFVEAGTVPPVDDPGFGVFDLVFDWATGGWRLTGCVD